MGSRVGKTILNLEQTTTTIVAEGLLGNLSSKDFAFRVSRAW